LSEAERFAGRQSRAWFALVLDVDEYFVTFANEAVYRAGKQLKKQTIVADVERRHDYRPVSWPVASARVS